ncbi:tetratricopeptide repeat protein [Solirubrobacter ginsenosidimutans]|uniref:Tetratricopeptide repeat protein n=1 Tax=Solirubrobacter ginsenosidimutans TaxID=490573 RepID=A0A9X3N0I2_9ACTN|nr:CheR family methyltransferase [Solirubrobacter ginsenosidimutans]MDA0164823.1 tetratricopeptide repeat protein [Solirubrobacter ginsenosidimutans]
MDEARTLVRDRLGLDFPARREADLERALDGATDAPRELLDALRAQPTTDPRWRALIRALTIQESYFFRDAALYAALVERVLPDLIAQRRAAGDLRLSLWSAGCAAGQEPYSLAMVVDRLLPDRTGWRVSIQASDLDTHALEVARSGVYGDWALRDLPVWARGHFDSRDPRRHVVDERIRAMVQFAPLNLATEAYPGSLDLIVCRNVLMYLADDIRHEAVVRLGRALAPEGWLVVSPLDSTPASEANLLAPVELAGVRLLRRRDSAPPVPTQAQPDQRKTPAAPPLESALQRARAAADRGQLDDAIALCLQALRDDPLDAEAHLLTAAVEEERGDLPAAIAAVRRAIYSEPDSANAHFRLGSLLLRRGDEESGRRSLTTAAELFGEHAPASLLARVER